MQFGLRRRQFITLLGGAAAWPVAARAQQPAMPVIGYLSTTSRAPNTHLITIVRQTLADAGFVEGRNLAIEFRWAEGQYDRLPALATELARSQVALIIAPTSPAAFAAKAATATIPIVFASGEDPVRFGLITSFARPTGNLTGINFFVTELAAKQLGLMREMIPGAAHVGLLINPTNRNVGEVMRELTARAVALGVKIELIEATDRAGIEAAFRTLARNKVDALVVGGDPFFYSRRLQLATLATRHAIPAVYNVREFAEAGGLLSYGTSLTEVYKLLGDYAARILKGAKPAQLPVVQSTKFELVVNLPTANALGLEVPPTLLAHADEVIE